MTTFDPVAWDAIKCLLDNVDQRTRDLLLWGSWSDGRHHPCECCGTSIVVLESTRSPADITNTWRRWVEVVSGSIDNGVCDVSIRVHTAQRCQQLRQENQA